MFGDMLRIVMSSIMRCRNAETCWDIEYSCLFELHERAIFSDRMLGCDGHFPSQPLARVGKQLFCLVSRMALLSHSLLLVWTD